MILVTGGTGFLGAHLLIELCMDDAESIRALRRPASDTEMVRKLFGFYGKEKLFGRIEWRECDLRDMDAVAEALEGVSIVYHCAAKVSFWKKDRGEMQHTNVEGTQNLIDAALEMGVEKLCYVSSIAALGRAEMICEDTVWDGTERHSDYARSKFDADLEVWRASAEGLETVMVRPSVIVGPWKQDSGTGSLFGQIGKGLKYYTGGANSFVDVRDVAKVMVWLTKSQVVNDSFIVTAENLGYREIMGKIAKCIGKKPPQKHATPFITDIAWRMNAFKDLFSKRKSSFTKGAARISQNTSKYSNEKLKKAMPFSYIPIEESLENSQRFYMFLLN